MLKSHGVRPYVVFDGGYLPMKAGTEAERHERRQKKLIEARKLFNGGNRKAAFEMFQQCVDITPKIALEFIKALKEANIPYVVAPYEADAQLAYLEKEGIVDGIITEDSDLLVFGSMNILFKLDKDGYAVKVKAQNFDDVESVNMNGWTQKEFRQMCILSGCDYLPRIPKLGLKKAYKLMRQHNDIEKAVTAAKFEMRLDVPSDYLQKFKLAEFTFLHQRVYCPKQEKLVTLYPVTDEFAESETEALFMENIGPNMDQKKAKSIALGELDPLSGDMIWNASEPAISMKKVESVRAETHVEKENINQEQKVVHESRSKIESNIIHEQKSIKKSCKLVEYFERNSAKRSYISDSPKKEVKVSRYFQRKLLNTATSIKKMLHNNETNSDFNVSSSSRN